MSYSSITVIYNPNSTGPGHELAKAFADRFAGTPYDGVVQLKATKHAGHAEELAYELARGSAHPLIISSSGDGGYHEIVNGAMAARGEGAHPVTGLLPAGNANDHYRSLHQKPVEEMILKNERHLVDLLLVEVAGPGGKWQRHAHSYAGVGLTPQVGRELNKVDLNPVKEKIITLRALWQTRPVSVIVDGHEDRYDSIIASNVPQMSKVLAVSKEASLTDGRFEISVLAHHTRWKLWRYLFRAATSGLDGHNHTDSYEFRASEPMLIQLDGEIKRLAAGDLVSISVLPGALHSVV